MKGSGTDRTSRTVPRAGLYVNTSCLTEKGRDRERRQRERRKRERRKRERRETENRIQDGEKEQEMR